MSDPLVTPDDLALYMGDDRMDEDRGQLMIGLAQAQCEVILSPLPQSAAAILLRIAARGYTSVLSPRQAQNAAAGGVFTGGASGVYRTDKDTDDLIRIAQAQSVSGVGAFTIRTPPCGQPRVLDSEFPVYGRAGMYGWPL